MAGLRTFARRAPAFYARLGVGVLLSAIFLRAIVRYGWVAEDAYITLRTVDNVVHGFGARWNVAERVQAYTHPLWMLVLCGVYAVTREDFLTLVFTCATISVLAFAMVQRLVASTMQAILCGAILILSPAYVDFSTSGLENALSHFLLAVFAVVYFDEREHQFALGRLTFVAALCMTNRLDLGLLVLPVLAFETARARLEWRARVAQLAVGLSPIIAWELFSIVYYGFPFPNTAYAKLNTGVPARELWRQGLGYIASHRDNDPLTLAAIFAGLVFGISSRDSKLRLLAAGVALYLLYVLRVGGDFMLGRFLTPPLLMATILVGRCQILRTRAVVSIPFAVAIVALGVWAPRTPLRAALQPKPSVDAHGVADERLIYALHSSLAARRDGAVMPDHYWAQTGRALRREGRSAVIIKPSVGFLGYFAGPLVHIIDENALTDPLLARLPIAPGEWRIGHFTRAIPVGYVETVTTGTNRIDDRRVARLYERLALVTRGPLFRWSRLAAIVRLTTSPTPPRSE